MVKRVLTERQVIAILGVREPARKQRQRTPENEWSNKKLAEHFGVSRRTIDQIWAGRTYKEIYARFYAVKGAKNAEDKKPGSGRTPRIFASASSDPLGH